jgi:putative membrane protein
MNTPSMNKPSMNKTVQALSAVVALGLAACGGGDDSKEFYTKAVQGDASEMMLGELAAKQGESEGVKSFGQTLQSDHAAAADKVKQAAAAAGVTVAETPAKEARDEYEKLSKLTGADFDKEFASYMADDHKKDIADFEKAAKSKDPKVAQLARDTLPTLRKHLEMAESLNK